MMWSLATPMWVAPSSTSASVDPSTPIVAAYGPGSDAPPRGLPAPKCCRNSSYVPSTRCTRIPATVPTPLSPPARPSSRLGHRAPRGTRNVVSERSGIPLSPPSVHRRAWTCVARRPSRVCRHSPLVSTGSWRSDNSMHLDVARQHFDHLVRRGVFVRVAPAVYAAAAAPDTWERKLMAGCSRSVQPLASATNRPPACMDSIGHWTAAWSSPSHEGTATPGRSVACTRRAGLARWMSSRSDRSV